MDFVKLMEIESESASGVTYTWTEEGGHGMELKIPYFGIMRPVLSTPQEEVSKQDEFVPLNSNLIEMNLGSESVMEDMMSIAQEVSTNLWDFGDLVETRSDEFDYPLEIVHPN